MVGFLLARFYEAQEFQFRNSSNKTSTGRFSKGNGVCFYDTLMETIHSSSGRERFLSHGKDRWHKPCCTLKLLEIRAEHDLPTEAQIFNLISISFATCIQCGSEGRVPFPIAKRSLRPTKVVIL